MFILNCKRKMISTNMTFILFIQANLAFEIGRHISRSSWCKCHDEICIPVDKVFNQASQPILHLYIYHKISTTKYYSNKTLAISRIRNLHRFSFLIDVWSFAFDLYQDDLSEWSGLTDQKTMFWFVILTPISNQKPISKA